MNTTERLRTLYEYYLMNPRVGHTTAMLRGATNTERAIILVGHHSQKQHIQPSAPHALFLSWGSLGSGAMKGYSRPLLIDNHAMTNILGDALTEIERMSADSEEVVRLRAHLHSRERHPDYEYETKTGPRKAFYYQDVPPEGEGWEVNTDMGRDGWERFDYHEEAYWRRRKPASTE